MKPVRGADRHTQDGLGHALLGRFGDNSSGSGCHHFDRAFRRHIRSLAKLPLPTSVVNTDARTRVAFRAAGRCDRSRIAAAEKRGLHAVQK